MRIEEIIELIVQIEEDYLLFTEENKALCAACSILNKLPMTMYEDDAKERIKTLCEKNEKRSH